MAIVSALDSVSICMLPVIAVLQLALHSELHPMYSMEMAICNAVSHQYHAVSFKSDLALTTVLAVVWMLSPYAFGGRLCFTEY